MSLSNPRNLDAAVTALRNSDMAVGERCATSVEGARDALEGFILAARRMGMSDIYGILRSNIAEENSIEARKITAALDLLQNEGVSTEEPDLMSILSERA